MITEELIPKKSTYEKFHNTQEGNIPIESVGPLLHKLHEAFEIAAEGIDTKWGDTDEADAISHIMGKIWEKYQDSATFEQRSTWR